VADLFSSFQTIAKIAEQNNPQNSGPSVPLMHIYWSSKAGEDKDRIIRLLHEGCITVPYHEMIRTVGGKITDAVCLSATMIENHGKCPLCAKGYTVTDRGMGIAVVREEKIEGDGPNRRSIIRDKTVEIEDWQTKAKSRVLFLGTIKQSLGNFWNSLAPVAYRYGDVTTRDLQVTRVGSGTSTTYAFLPFEPEPEMDTLDKVLARYKEAMGGQSPQQLIVERLNRKSSDAYYKKNFGADIFVASEIDTAQPQDQPYSTAHLTAVGAESKPQDGPSQTTFADLRSKLQSYGTGGNTDVPSQGYSEEPPF